MRLCSPVLVALLWLLPGLTSAQTTADTAVASHGRRGQWLVGGASRAAIGGAHFAFRKTLTTLPKDRFELAVSPSAAVFVAPRLAIGLAGDFELVRAERRTSWAVAVGPHALGYVPLGKAFGLLPTLAVYYAHAFAEDRLALSFKALALWHVAPGLSLAAGPQVAQDVWRRDSALRITSYDAIVSVLGWL